MSNLSVSDVVSLSVLVAAEPPTQASFSGVLIVGDSSKLSLAERVKKFTVDTYGGAFSVSDPEYVTASKHFAQSPAPQDVYIGRRFSAAQAGTLAGAPAAALATLQAITAGAFDITVDSTLIHVTAQNFSGNTLAQIAGELQTALQVVLASTLCVVNAAETGFTITSPTTGTSSQVSYATPTSGDATTADALGLTSDAGALRTTGIAAESTVTDSLNAMKVKSGAWYAFELTATASLADQTAAAEWAETNKRPFFVTTASPAAFATPTDADTDIAGYAKRKGYAYTIPNYSTDSLNLGASALARISVVDYNAYRSTIDLWGKQMPGISPEGLDENIRAGLLAKNCNFYATFGDYPMYSPGNVANGRPIDEVIGLAWQASEIQTQCFAALLADNGIAQTDAEIARLVTAFESALKKGVNNGLLAPGYWPKTSRQVGNVKPGDFMSMGFAVFADSVATQSETDRATRISPPIIGIARGGGRLRGAALTFIFNR